ncbi:MAG TPA: sulfatase-like hydrolase/transferase [Acidobacteriota bacterium]
MALARVVAQEVAAPQRLNLILITIDTVRADHLGSYGHPARATPALDRLAQSGIVWTDAGTPAPLTLPAHASLLSGLYPMEHGLRVNGRGRLDSKTPTLASLLAKRAYHTAAVVGSFLLDRRFGLARGFARFDDRMPPASLADRGGDRLAAPHHPERDGAEVMSAALRLLESLREPFFLWVHLYDPHDPYTAPEALRRHFRDPYVAEIAYADRQVQRLVDELGRRRLWPRTIVVATSDHGEDRGDHGEETHGFFVYQSTLRVPLIARLPDRSHAGARRDEPVSLVDLVPTLCALLGVEAPPGAAGRDLLRGTVDPERPLYAETFFPRLEFGWSELRSLRAGKWKLIEAPRPELYDLDGDPSERINRYHDERPVAAGLEKELRSMKAKERPSQAAAPDPETRAALRALGYAGTAGATPSQESSIPLADPKDRLAERRALLELDRLAPKPRAARLAGLRRADPTNPTFALLHAQALAESGSTRDALDLLTASGPAWDGAAAISRLYWMGKYQIELGAAEAAEKSFRALLDLDPGNTSASHLLIGLLLNAGSAEEARSQAAALTEAHPDSGLAHALLAASERAAGNLTAAQVAATRGVNIDPNEPQAQRQLGLVLLQLEPPQSAAAERALATAAKLSPHDALIAYEHARALLACGRPAEAREQARRFLKLAAGRFPDLESAAKRLLEAKNDASEDP